VKSVAESRLDNGVSLVAAGRCTFKGYALHTGSGGCGSGAVQCVSWNWDWSRLSCCKKDGKARLRVGLGRPIFRTLLPVIIVL
jgi:hypothetical protein